MNTNCSTTGTCGTAPKATPESSRVPVLRPVSWVTEGAAGWTVTVELPGADEHTTEIDLQDQSLVVTAKVVSTATPRHGAVMREYRVGDYCTEFQVADVVDRERIEAQFVQGLLTIQLPKRGTASPQKIVIRGTDAPPSDAAQPDQ